MGMTDSIDLTPAQRAQVQALITRYLPGTTVWAFGSRVSFKSRPDSDLDLVAFTTPVQKPQVHALKEAFEESDLPFRVDLLVWDDIPEIFKKNIEGGEFFPIDPDALSATARAVSNISNLGSKNDFFTTAKLSEFISFKNGKSSPLRMDTGNYLVFGSNGVIGKSNQKNTRSGTIIVGRVGSYCGSIYYSESECWVTDNAIIGECQYDDAKFWYYFLFSKNLNLLKTGSGQPLINQSILNSLEVVVPSSIDNRIKIASILSALDDKIALNRATNQTLEQIAQTLFKSWFVDFDPVYAKARGEQPVGMDAATAALFPDSFQQSELGLIPTGWEVKKLGEIVRYREGKTSSKELNLHNYISTENMISNRGGITVTTSVPGASTVASFKRGDTLISNIRPYFKKIWFASFDGGRSNDVLAFYPLDTGTEPFLHYLLNQDDFFDFMMTTSKGAKMPRGDKDAIEKLLLVIPPENIRIEFSSLTTKLLSKMEINTVEIDILVSLRDSLLPKLLSGEISLTTEDSVLKVIS